MSAQRVGPLYGPLPDLAPAWAIAAPVAYTAEDVRELLRDVMELRVNKESLHRLSLAMNSVAALSSLAVKKIQADLLRHMDLQVKVDEIRAKVPTSVSPDGLPIIKADVVEYSEEPLKQGKTYAAMAIQPLEEEISRLAVKICLALDLEAFGLDEAPCCQGGYGMGGAMRQPQLIRS